MANQIDSEYVTEVINTLRSNPTASELDYLVEAYSTIAYYAAVAEGIASEKEAIRKNEEANIILTKRREDGKVPMVALEAEAYTGTFDLRRAENKARTDARKLSNLLNSIEQAINAIKFIGRNTSVSF